MSLDSGLVLCLQLLEGIFLQPEQPSESSALVWVELQRNDEQTAEP